jgi:hypothetical protein
MSPDRSNSPFWWWSVGAIALAGLLLRFAASHGGLWTDEAWSVIYALQARDPIGVFLRINHDNNHHLISLWLQAIGMRAPPWLARLPAVLAGASAIVVAALIAARRSRVAGIVAALLFAFSPIMVTYGSEARGYALMMLAALTMLLIVLRSVKQERTRATPWWLGLISLFGMLSHMTGAAPVVLISLWAYLEQRAVEGSEHAFWKIAKLMGPALVIAAAFPVFVIVAGVTSPGGMRVGGYIPFHWSDYREALTNLATWTLGITELPGWIALLASALIAIALALWPPGWLGTRARLYVVLILGVPLGVVLCRAPNTEFARYFLCSAIGLLLVISEWFGRMFAKDGARRAVAATALGVILFSSLWQDAALLRIERGHPDQIVQLMQQRSPAGGTLAVETARLEAVTRVAAYRADFPLDLVGGCAPAQFAVSSEPKRLGNRGPLVRCGVTMRPIGTASGTALTGDRWVLYQADKPTVFQLANR